jgi:hypothetical protein
VCVLELEMRENIFLSFQIVSGCVIFFFSLISLNFLMNWAQLARSKLLVGETFDKATGYE